MVCRKCGKEIDENSKFCNECGTETKTAIDLQISEADNTEKTDFDLDSLKKKLYSKIQRFIKNNRLFTGTAVSSLFFYFLADITGSDFLGIICLILGLIAISDFVLRRAPIEALKKQNEVNENLRYLRGSHHYRDFIKDINNKK